MMTSQLADNRDDMRLLKLSRGVLEVEQFARRVITYTAKAQTLAGITNRRDKLDQRANELRSNILAIAKNPAAAPQRAKWTRQLDDFTSEGNKLGAQLADLEAKRLDQRIELENLLQELEITPPAPKASRP